MKITFVRPVFNREDLRPVVDIPLGLLSLTTILSGAEHEVCVVDLQLLLVQGRLPFTDDYYRRAAELICTDNPEVIGFTALCNSYPNAVLIARECHNLLPDVQILFGGPQATFVARETLQEFAWVDVVVRGEGERVILPLIEALERGGELEQIAGITYRTKTGAIISNADQEYIANLDTLPDLDYMLLEQCEEYFHSGASISLEVGRGCPYHCRYCSTSMLWRRQFRIKSPERIVHEIAELYHTYGVKTVKLTHDLFTVNKEIALRFCHLIREQCPEVTWACSARTSTMDEELLQAFAESGCQMIFYGIESGSPEVLQYYRKEIDLEEARRIVKATLAKKIKAMMSFIVGAPVEKADNINQTLALGLQFKVMGAHTAQIHLLVPESGTDLYRENSDNLLLGVNFSEEHARLLYPYSAAEVELIRRYPQIFSTFYTIPNQHVPLEVLYAIEETFCRLLNVFPRAIYLILQEKGWQPLDLLAAWTDWRESVASRGTHTGVEPGVFEGSEEALVSFETFVRARMKAGELFIPYLSELLTYEKTFATFVERDYFVDKTPCWQSLTEEMELSLSVECSLGHYQYDIPQLVEQLKELQYVPPEKKEVFLIFRYLGSYYVKSIVTNEFTYDILNGCTEPCTVSELEERFMAKWGSLGGMVESEFARALEYLVQQRLIKVSAKC